MTTIRPTLNIPQSQFMAMPHKFKAFVAGFGAGKTWTGCCSMAKHFYEFPRINAGYFAPTYRDIRDVFVPTIEECLYDWGMNTRYRQGNQEIDVYVGKIFYGVIKCRSMDNPGSIVGFKIGHAVVDEIDIMEQLKALTAWRKIIARMRYTVPGLRNGIDVTTTPEGFKFVYDHFVRELRNNPSKRKTYGLIQSSTYENEINLPPDYISSLYETYPAQLIDAYLLGKFVNLLTGTIYKGFDRKLNHCDEVILPKENVYVGMDFNVGQMASVLHVERGKLPCAVGEITDGIDTPNMIRKLKERLWEYSGDDYIKTRRIIIYPDASGNSRKTNDASKTDIQLLKQAGFEVKAPRANPPVKDRINSMNAMFCNAANERRYMVNTNTCPIYTDCLEQQAYTKNGDPDKTTGFDHINDAGGYYINKEFPIVKQSAALRTIRGF